MSPIDRMLTALGDNQSPPNLEITLEPRRLQQAFHQFKGLHPSAIQRLPWPIIIYINTISVTTMKSWCKEWYRPISVWGWIQAQILRVKLPDLVMQICSSRIGHVLSCQSMHISNLCATIARRPRELPIFPSESCKMQVMQDNRNEHYNLCYPKSKCL